MKKIYKFVALSCLSFLLLSFTPLIQAQPMSTLPLKAWKSSDNSVTIETSHLKIVVEQLSQIHYRISCYIKQSAETIEYDVIDNGFEKIILVNGREVSRVPVKQPSTSQSSGESSTQSTIYYWWDGIRFVKGLYIKYPHADRDYYGISPFSSWLSAGYKLYHYQIDRATSQALNAGGGAAIGAAIGAIIGGLIGGTAGAVVGAIAGAVITQL